jgi:hypothetical protein
MEDSVEVIKELKHKRFRSAAPFCEDGSCAISVDVEAQELYHALGCILSVTIHHDNCVAASRLLNVHETDGDRSLVAKIAAQTQ